MKLPTNFIAILGCFLLVGCGAKGHPPTYPVNGNLMFEGKPLANAEVTFSPRDASGRLCRGSSDADGKFKLKTYFGPGADAEGAAAGEYTVMVRKVAIPAGGIDPYKQKMPPNQVPRRYDDAGKSPLKVTVTAEGPNEPTLEITR